MREGGWQEMQTEGKALRQQEIVARPLHPVKTKPKRTSESINNSCSQRLPDTPMKVMTMDDNEKGTDDKDDIEKITW